MQHSSGNLSAGHLLPALAVVPHDMPAATCCLSQARVLLCSSNPQDRSSAQFVSSEVGAMPTVFETDIESSVERKQSSTDLDIVRLRARYNV